MQNPRYKRFKFLALLISACLITVIAAACGTEEEAQREPEPEMMITDLPAQSSQSGQVTVSVTPRDLSPGASEWVFDITVDSHGPELSEDLAAAAVIVDETGAELAVSSYSGDGPGGHHRQGELHFQPLKPTPTSITLKVRGVAGVGERSFSWMVGS
jgi:hypothetical protein